MKLKYGEEGIKKGSAPRCSTPESGSGSIKTPHGTEPNMKYLCSAQKKPTKQVGELSRLIQM